MKNQYHFIYWNFHCPTARISEVKSSGADLNQKFHSTQDVMSNISDTMRVLHFRAVSHS